MDAVIGAPRRKKENHYGSTYAAIVLAPGGVISWLVVGLIAGWLAAWS